VGEAQAGEGKGVGHSCGSEHSPCGLGDGGAGKGVSVVALLNGKGALTNFNGAGGGPAAPRGKCDSGACLNWRKTQMSAVSPPERRTTVAVAQNSVRGRGLSSQNLPIKLTVRRGS
jgi:hypothetical protein